MKNFTTTIINRKVCVSFDHPVLVVATFQAQSTSFACQGQWSTETVTILKNEYSMDKLKEAVEKDFNVYYY